MKSKKVIIRIITFVMLIVSLAFVPWGIVKMWASPLSETIQMDIESAVTNHNLDGVIVYVNQGGKASFYSAGWKDRDKKTEADPESLFKIASISKLYIAVAATKLIDEQRLNLDDTLSTLMPEYANQIEFSDKITLRMLIKHRSGIPDFIKLKAFPWSNLPISNKDALKLVLGMSADFSPDSKYAYSNTNYLLIGEIMDKALGYSHQQYIKEEILEPLNLTNTFSFLKEVNQQDVMSGYDVGYDGDLKLSDYTIPGGSMVATAEDVGIFLRALNDGSLMTESERTLYSELYVYEHTGLLPGYQSIARYDKERDTVVILFVNTSGGDSWTKIEILYNRIMKILSK